MSSSDPVVRRVLIADDSPLMRSMLREQITHSGSFDVVGEAASGYQVIRMVHELDPDIITLDLAMPELGGVEALDYVLSNAPRPVVIISAHDRSLADPVLNAMVSGAVEFVAKPAGSSIEEASAFRNRLYQALRAASVAHLMNLPKRIQLSQERERRTHPMARCAVAIAASTGGPRALTDIVPRLSPGIPAAVFVVQHMPPLFTSAFARRLDDMCALPVREAEQDAVVEEGVVYVARGGAHLDLRRESGAVHIVLSDALPEWNVRPAADVLFRAVARTFGPASVGVVLTGMGRDGAEGLRTIAEVGGSTLVQDEESCVIASMPKAAAPHAQRVVPLASLGAEIGRQAQLRSKSRSG